MHLQSGKLFENVMETVYTVMLFGESCFCRHILKVVFGVFCSCLRRQARIWNMKHFLW